MKRVSLVVLIVLASLLSFSQTQFQIERNVYGSFGNEGKNGGHWTTFLSYNFECGLGIYNYSKSNDSDWYESILGLNYKIDISKFTTIEIGMGAGIERWCDKARYSSYLYYLNNPNRDNCEINQTRVSVNYELRPGDTWFRGYVSHNLGEHFALGASYQSDAALGPRVDFMHSFLNAWIVPGYFQGDKSFGLQAGLGLCF